MITIEGKLLDELIPVNELSAASRRQLAEKAKVAKLRSQKRLTAKEEHRWLLYLLEGEIRLESSAGESEAVIAGSERAASPLFSEQTRAVRAVASANSTIIRFDKRLYEVLAEKQRDTGYNVVDIHTVLAENKVVQHIFRAFSKQELDFPPFPDLALRVRDTLKDPDAGAAELTKVIAGDDAAAEHLLQLAASDLYPRIDNPATLEAAVEGLGAEAAGALTMTLAISDVYQRPLQHLQERMAQLQKHVIEVAALSYCLAEKIDGLQREGALLAGVLSDVGVVPILAHVDQLDLDTDTATLDTALATLRSLVGAMATNRWGLDSEFEAVAEHSEDWKRDTGVSADYCDLVSAVKAMTYQGSARAATMPALERIPAFCKLNALQQGAIGGAGVYEGLEDTIMGIRLFLEK